VAFVTAYNNPDGCTIDAHGRLWIAHWGSSRVVCYDVSAGGKVVVEIIIPSATRVSSCSFGGPTLEDLLITTAYEGMTEPDRDSRAAVGEGFAGDIFLVRGVSKGIPPNLFKG